ncbi:hypothetical protein QZH41_018475, partial [Actinostola sp. cb2023]
FKSADSTIVLAQTFQDGGRSMAFFLRNFKRICNPSSATLIPVSRRICLYSTEYFSYNTRRYTTETITKTDLPKQASRKSKASKKELENDSHSKTSTKSKTKVKEKKVVKASKTKKNTDEKLTEAKNVNKTTKLRNKGVTKKDNKLQNATKRPSVTTTLIDKNKKDPRLHDEVHRGSESTVYNSDVVVKSEILTENNGEATAVTTREYTEAEDVRSNDNSDFLSNKEFAVGRVGMKYREGTIGARLYEVSTLAEINGYLSLGQVNEAQKLFNRYLRIGKTLGIASFNKMLLGWAEHGNLMSVKMTFNLLKSDGLKPDISTYAALLFGYGRFGETEKVKEIMKEMEGNGLNPEHIFYKCLLTENQAKGVMHALHLVDPDFKATVPPEYHNTHYPSLVRPLYDSMAEGFNEKVVDGRLNNEFSEHELQVLLEEQLLRELCGVTVIKSVEQVQEQDEEMKKLRGIYEEWRVKCKAALMKVIDEELQEIKGGKFKSLRPRYAPFLQTFDAEELADLTLDQVMFYIKGQVEGVPLHSLSGAVGSALNAKYIVKQREKAGVLKKIKNIYSDYFSYVMDEQHSSKKMARDRWDELDLGRPYEASLRQDISDWPWATKLLCGCTLIDFLLQSITINANLFNNKPESLLAAFYHTYEFRERRKIGVIKPHPVVCKLFKGYLADHGSIVMATTSVPMLVPPRPWRDVRDGAFLLQPVQLMRTNQEDDSKQDRLLEDKCSRNQLCAVFDALNSLGACAWKTNDRILDLAVHYFNNGGSDDLAIPGPVVQPDTNAFDKTGLPPEERMKILQEHRRARKIAREQYSLRMSALYKLSVANHFRNNVFWLPLNMDFRGRVYPIPPHCCHVGDDLNRGMLQFNKGVALGEHGLRWLKIHLTNLHGAKKKASLNERAEYADEMMDEILDSADDPLMGRQWWMSADEPWQTLATCIEISNAVRSDDHTQYVSHHPVHQDGSCNGLQHYAALGHDSYGAKQVNLMPADRPQDVYMEVAKLVEMTRVKDAEKGHKIAQHLEGKVKRKVIKQTVMTIVYGVTFVGGRLQIERQLKDLDIDERLLFDSSAYLVHKVFASIGQLFSSAKAIQDWLAIAATHIAYTGHMVDWYTPLSLYVCQPYCKRTVKVIRTKLQGIEIPAKGLASSPPDSRKQRGAFPPNFVHSLDSTHMMLSALYSQRAGITFTSVHDSFWTHAASIDVMNKVPY